jgi:predicted enzyme related to lactoylglutathione lyase
MKPQVIKYVLMAQDMDRAVSFYRDTMGFAQGTVSPYWSELRFGDAILGLHGGGDGSRNQTGLSIQYQDVRKAFAVAVESGAKAVQPPEQREGEPIILSSISDPEGNVIMLTQYVGDE